MIPIYYRNYPYAPIATLVSGISFFGAFLSLIFGILLGIQVMKNPVMIVPGLLLIGLAAFLFFYVGRTVTDKMAEKETEKNIKTKPRFAALYVNNHPAEYENIAQVNPEFGQKYVMNEKGRCVKRK